jgi:CHAD domain-containing protein
MGAKQLRRYARQLLITIDQKHQTLLRQEADEETIHDFRVAIRRLTPVINLLIEIEQSKKNRKKLAHHKRVLKTVFRILSEPRDLEVQIRLATTLKAHLKDAETEINGYINKLQSQEKQLAHELVETIQQIMFSSNISVLGQFMEHHSIDKNALKDQMQMDYESNKKTLKKSMKRMKNDLTAFHTTRIQLKKFRYFLELSSVIDQTKETRLPQLKHAQDHLGETNDLRNAIQLMTIHHVRHSLIEQIEKIYIKHLHQTTASICSNIKQFDI